MSFQLKTSYFEGPLELLLDLIESKKLHVSEISLAEVTNDYLSYINSFTDSLEIENKESNDIEQFLYDRSQFLTVAATLVLIKARSLLPVMELSPEETESIDDLTERLRLYEIIKKYGEILAKQLERKPTMYRGNPPKEKKIPVFAPHESLSSEILISVLGDLFTALPVTEKLIEKSVKTTITLAEVMDRVTQAVQSGITFSLRDATDRYKNASNQSERREAKVLAVLSFLAVLEMVKKAMVSVEQHNLFDDIVAHPYHEIEQI
jgi:segregation and condensation protein A